MSNVDKYETIRKHQSLHGYYIIGCDHTINPYRGTIWVLKGESGQ